MRCDAVRGTVVGGQQAGRLAVQRGETRGRELSDKGLAHDRMYEGQLASSCEHVGGTQRVGGHLSAVTVQGSEGRCVSQSAAGAEHRRGLRQSLTVGTQLCEPDQHTATNRACAELADPAGELNRRPGRLLVQCRRQFAEIEGISPRRLVTRSAQLLIRARPEPVANHRGAAFLGQRTEPKLDRRQLSQRCRREILARPLAASHRDRQEHRQGIKAAGQIHQKSCRGRIEPLRVVYQQCDGSTLCQARHKPIQAVQHRRNEVALRVLSAVVVEYRRSEPSRAVPEALSGRPNLPPQQVADRCERRFHHKLVRPGAQHEHPARAGAPSALLHQRCLADARRPCDEQRLAVAGDRPVE